LPVGLRLWPDAPHARYCEPTVVAVWIS
jgi:hypothetical protein